MKTLTVEEMYLLDFPTHDIEEMLIDCSRKRVVIKIDFGWLDINGGRWIENCVVTLSNWKKLEVILYDLNGQERRFNSDNIEKLTDICIFEYGEDIVFEGAPVGEGWLKYKFIGANMVVEYEKSSRE